MSDEICMSIASDASVPGLSFSTSAIALAASTAVFASATSSSYDRTTRRIDSRLNVMCSPRRSSSRLTSSVT